MPLDAFALVAGLGLVAVPAVGGLIWTPGTFRLTWAALLLGIVSLIVDGHHLAEEIVRLVWRAAAGRGASAYPQMSFVSLVENGTHVLFGTRMADYATGEITLAPEVISSLRPGMLSRPGAARPPA